jgi:CubicO group peptidase (beta-lactamase class C family)
MQNNITIRVHRALQEKIFPGCVIGVIDRAGWHMVAPFGKFTFEEASPDVGEDTLYDTASITKAIPTSSLALMLLDRGEVSLNDLLIRYIPEFSNSMRNRVRIKHLLTYSIDGYGLGAYKDMSSNEITRTIFTKDFEQEPGTLFKYTNIPAFLLGLVVERVMGASLDVLATEYFFRPLGMEHSTFHVPPSEQHLVPPTEICPWRGQVVQGVVHDESAWRFAHEGKVVGHAGLFSTVPDLMRFARMILDGGIVGERRYFSERIIREMYTNQLSIPGETCGLGWEMGQVRYIGTQASQKTFAKTGFTGCLFACDMEQGKAFVILSNRTFPRRSPNSDAINAFRADIANIVFDTIV